MRALSGRLAIVVALMTAVGGCRGGGWPWSGNASDPMASGHGEPQLPSANAAPAANYGSPYDTAASTGGPSAFAEPAGAAPYQAAPYPGQPAGYTGTSGMPPAGGAAPANYAGMPQQGPYHENYAQASPQPSPNTGYPTTSTPQGYQPAAAAPPAGGADPYASSGAYGDPGGYGAPPPAQTAGPETAAPGGAPAANVNYSPDDSGSSGGYRTADVRYDATPDPAPAQPEEAAADRYGSSSQAEPAAAAAQLPGNRPGEPYRPGSTGYQPGQTGYSPPGVASYQTPGQPNVVSQSQSQPHYRPGGTGDYAPAGGATPAASADRYDTPPIDNSQDPYAQ